MHVIERLKAPTPPFFAKLRTIGLVLATVAGVLLTTPIVLPVMVINIAGYVALAGGVISAVSQLSVRDPIPELKDPLIKIKTNDSVNKELESSLKNKQPTILKLINASNSKSRFIKRAYL